MPTSWQHPTLGRLEFNRFGWGAVVDVPAFKRFSYDTGYPNARRSKGKHDLRLEAPGEGRKPSAAVVKLALAVIENQAALVTEICRALWEGFNGRGPKSAMWWWGGLDEVAEVMDDGIPRPADAEGVAALLQVSGIAIHGESKWTPRPVVEITFHAAFEEEHGVSVLTDGRKVIGTGYMLDAQPYQQPKPRAPRKSRTPGKPVAKREPRATTPKK
jgi:hypothetical protein